MSASNFKTVSDRFAALLGDCDRVLALLAGTKALLHDQFSDGSVEARALCSITAETTQVVRDEIDQLALDLHRAANEAQS